MPRPSRLLSLLALPLLVGCIDRAVTQIEPEADSTENLEFEVTLDRKLDILFVIDDSNSMEREQLEITANFHRMISVLERLPGGLPSLHLAVVSTDVGAGDACASAPLAGVLRNRPMIAGCSPPTDRWIADVDDGTGTGARRRNYAGDLADSFACIATLGLGGCGFEQPLEAMRRALSPATVENRGFLRDDAFLAVVLLTDEDDCSAFDPGLFTRDTTTLGPRKGFRCFAQGIECEGVDPTTLGVRDGCAPRDDSPYLTPISEYVDALRALKPSDSRIVVAGIMGDPGPIEVILDSAQHPALRRTCELDPSDPHGAHAPLRTDAFLAGFERPVRTRICDADLSPAMEEIGKVIVERIVGSCLTGQLRDGNLDLPGLQPDCSVTETQHPGTAAETTAVLPQCDAASATNPPCWSIEADEAICTTTHLKVVTSYPPGVTREPDTLIRVQCATE